MALAPITRELPVVTGPAATASGAAWLLTWGGNQSGQLGGSDYSQYETTPRRVMLAAAPDATMVVNVSAGVAHCVALTADRRVHTWGHNGYGQLGLGDTAHRPAPEAVAGIGSATTVAAGALHSLALVDGNVYAWGFNYLGALGNGISGETSGIATPIPTPVTQPVPPLAGGTRFAYVAAGYQFSLALTSDGKLYAWGRNCEGQLGTQTPERYSHTPLLVRGLEGIRIDAIAAGGSHGLALTADGHVYAWGAMGATAVGDLPTRVPAFESSRVGAVAAGRAHCLALTLDGRVFAWGENTFGQLGDGGTGSTSTPIPVQGLDGAAVRSIASGSSSDHSLAITADGVYAWGANYTGQLGNGTVSPPVQPGGTPVVVPGTRPTPDASTTVIAAGAYHSLAAGSDGAGRG